MLLLHSNSSVRSSERDSSESGDVGDASQLGVVVLVSKSNSLESVLLHFDVVVGANEIDIGLCGKLLQLLLGGVEVEDLLDAVEVLADVVLVGVDVEGLVNLILHCQRIIDDFINYIINHSPSLILLPSLNYINLTLIKFKLIL